MRQFNAYQAMADNSPAVLQTKLNTGTLALSKDVFQLAERTTSIHNREPHTNTFRKGMEIVDSTGTDTDVHISRNAEDDEDNIDIQQQPNYFNGLAEPNKRSREDEQPDDDPQVDLGMYAIANNGHITLEGRYARVMQGLATGFADLDGIKAGAPVDATFNNLNFGSSEDYGDAHASDYDIYTYIHNWAEDAEEYASRGLKILPDRRMSSWRR